MTQPAPTTPQAPPAAPPPPAAPAAPVHVVDEYGRVGTADPASLQAIQAGGGRLATPEEVHAADLEARRGGLGNAAIAGAEGFGRGITLGGTDLAAVEAARLFGGEKAAEAARTHLREEREEHPVTGIGGEVVGSVAPILASGGAAAPEEAAALAGRTGAKALGAIDEAGAMAGIGKSMRTLGVLPRGVAAMGDAAEHAMAGVLGATADTALGRAGQAAAKAASRAMVEGGLFGAGQAISEGTLDNDLTAEKVFSAIGHSALTAGLLGGTLSGAGSLAGDAVGSLLGKSGLKLEDAASDQAFANLDAKGANEAAIKRAGGRTELGKAYMDEVLRPAVEKDGITAAAMTNDQKLERVNQVLDDLSTQAKAKLAGSGAEVPIAEVLKPFDSRIEEFRGKLGQTAVAERMQQLRNEAARILMPGVQEGEDISARTVPIADLYAQKQSLQAAAYRAIKSMNPAEPVQQMREVSGEFNGLIEKYMNQASKEAGDGVAGTELRDLNKRMQRMMTIQDILEHNQVRYARNDTVSLTAKMAGMGEAAGALAAGHPLAALGAIPVAMATEAVKYHGNAYAALMIDRLAKFGGISRAAADFDEQVDKAVDGALAGKRRGMPSAFRGSAGASDKRFEDEESRVRQLAAMGPAVVAAHLQDRTAPMSTHMPNMAASIQKMATSQTAYLASKLPPEPMTQGPSLTPQLQKSSPSQVEKVAFLRAIDAVEGGPPAIMKRLAKGTMTQEDSEVLRDFYPESYKEIQQKIISKCADRKKPLDYQTRIHLGTLFGVATDPTLQPEFVAAAQKAFATQPQGQGSGETTTRRGAPPAELKAASQVAAEFEQAQGGA